MSGGEQRASGRMMDRVWAVLRRDVFRVHCRVSWPTVIERAGLPAGVDGRIREIVRRARLWNSESVDVARELVVHAQDALERGVEPGAVAEGLGGPAAVARLIRRAVRRKRHWLWHARVWTGRTIAALAVLTLLVAGMLTARFFIGKPRPTRNFIAEMNAPLEQYGEDERSWGPIREANIIIQTVQRRELGGMLERANRVNTDELTDEQRRLRVDQPGFDLVPGIEPGHPDYERMLGLLDEIRPCLEIAREAASRPVLGMLYSTRWPEDVDYSTKPPGWYDDPLPDSDDPAEQDLLISVLLPALSSIRSSCRWLAFDAVVAAREGDPGRIEDDLRAILGLAGQVNQDEMLISNLVAMACTELARETLGIVMRDHPGLLGRDRLVTLAHGLAEARKMFERLPLTWEINMFEDFLQRAYTDDGHGDGHMTDEGARVLAIVRGLVGPKADIEGSSRFALALAGSSRAGELETYRRAIGLVREDEAAGYEIFRGRGLQSAAWIEQERESRKYGPVWEFMPAFGKVIVVQALERAKIDGTLVAVAATLHRMETGAWPASVAELVPRYLPAVPEDPFTGGEMRLGVDDGGGVIVYCVGRDGDDDGGRMDASREHLIRPKADGRDPRLAGYVEKFDAVGWGTGRDGDQFVEAEDGDWVLFPPG